MTDTIEQYVEKAIRTFDNDPAEGDYQEGYLAALRDIQEHILIGRRLQEVDAAVGVKLDD